MHNSSMEVLFIISLFLEVPPLSTDMICIPKSSYPTAIQRLSLCDNLAHVMLKSLGMNSLQFLDGKLVPVTPL